MSVGRAALDPETMRLLERQNPGVTFDWPRLLKGDPTPEPRPRTEAVERRGRRERAPEPPVPAPPPAPETSAVAARPPVIVPAPDTPAGRRLGDEGYGRLRTRYLEMAARIEQKVEDPVRRAELNADVERLNPEAWTTDEAVTQGLEQYEAVHERLRGIVGRGRRRRSRPGTA